MDLSKLKRYRCVEFVEGQAVDSNPDRGHGFMERSQIGEFVKLEDVEALLAEQPKAVPDTSAPTVPPGGISYMAPTSEFRWRQTRENIFPGSSVETFKLEQKFASASGMEVWKLVPLVDVNCNTIDDMVVRWRP